MKNCVFDVLSSSSLPLATRYGNFPAQWKVRIHAESVYMDLSNRFRHFGMLLAAFGVKELSLENTLASFSLPLRLEEVKSLLL